MLLGAAIGCGRAERHFDADEAWTHLTAQVAFGPRVPGTEAHAQTLRYLEAHLRSCADQVSLHSFESTCPLDSSAVTYHNVVAVFRPEAAQRFLFGAHWDSRPIADQETDPVLRTQPVPGANDGASGVAVLLEVASALQRVPPEVGVDLVLFDGEDCGREGEPETYALGSQRFVQDHPEYRPGYAVILDMVGRDGARIPKEGMSVMAAPFLVEAVWRAAREIGATSFSDSVSRPIYDDHIPFLEAGIPAIDVIDMEDPAWHTTRDLPDNCSSETLSDVGRLVLELIRRAEDAGRR